MIKLAAIKALSNDYIVFELEGSIGIIKTSNIKAISEAMITEKRAASLPPVSIYDLNGINNPYELLQGKLCIIKLKKGGNSLFGDAKAYTPAKIIKVTDESLLVSFRGKELVLKSDDILMTIEKVDMAKK